MHLWTYKNTGKSVIDCSQIKNKVYRTHFQRPSGDELCRDVRNMMKLLIQLANC